MLGFLRRNLDKLLFALGIVLAVFAYGLGDLKPETVKEVGTAHCLARGGDVQLAPTPNATAAIAKEAGACEALIARSS